MPDFRDVYKNRAEAWAEFIEPHGLPVSRSKFYEDADRLRMVQPDKSVRLADLLAYARSELKVDAISGQRLRESPGDREREQRVAELELRKLQAEVEAREKANRKDDSRWMEVVDHETQMAAFAGRLEESLRQLTSLRLTELLHLVAAEPSRGADLAGALEELYAEAMTDAVRLAVQPIAFEDSGVLAA